MHASDAFERLLGAIPAVVAFAPGRVNLIGEHVDYHGGIVLPVPLAQGTHVAIAPEPGSRARFVSAAFGTSGPYPLDSFTRASDYAIYPLAVVAALRERRVEMPGFALAVAGDLPVGAGVSSSASFLVACCRAFDQWLGLGLDATTHAAIAHRAERHFVGVACGTMDQTVAALGRAGHALAIDCKTGATESIRLPSERLAFVVVDSGTRRALQQDGRFNARVRESTHAAEWFAGTRSGIQSLRDVTPADLDAARGRLDPTELARARHVVEEIARVESFIAALRAGKDALCGSLLDASHASLRDLYEVSTHALDALIDECRAIDGVLGARLTGAGFGGAILVLGPRGIEEAVGEVGLPRYRERGGAEGSVLAVI